MRIDYSDGSFMLSWEFCRAWYDPSGSLKDAEYTRSKVTGKVYENGRAVSAKHTKVRAYLETQGKQTADLLARGILKRKI